MFRLHGQSESWRNCLAKWWLTWNLFHFFCSQSRIGGKQDLLGVAPPYPWFLFSISSTKNFSDNSQKSNRNGKTLALWSTQYRSSASIFDARQSEHLSRLRKVYLASRLFGCQEKTPLTSFFFFNWIFLCTSYSAAHFYDYINVLTKKNLTDKCFLYVQYSIPEMHNFAWLLFYAYKLTFFILYLMQGELRIQRLEQPD